MPVMNALLTPKPKLNKGDCIMYSANQLNTNGKVTLYPFMPTIKALGAYIARCHKAFGEKPEMIAVYKNRKFHGYYTIQGDKLSKQGTVRLSQYIAI